MKNVLVFPCGAQPSIDINIALRNNGEYKVFGASSYEDHGAYIYENYIPAVPFIYEEDFIPRFNQLLDSYQIKYIIPVHDSMILFLQEHAKEIHATVVGSCYETALLCRYKSKTYKALSGKAFVPRIYSTEEVVELPVFIKKDDDQGARNAYKIETLEELRSFQGRSDMIICEYLPGEELTVDCFTDYQGSLRFCNARSRDRVLAGISVHARRVELSQEVLLIAKELNKEISFRGFWFFQLKRDAAGRLKLLEISTRFAGTFSLSRSMDVNLPLMALRDFDHKELDFGYNDYPLESDRMLINRYKLSYFYNSVYIDGVEAFVCNAGIDSFFMMFLYQCINKGKKIYLLTESKALCMDKLRKLRLSCELFTEIYDNRDYAGLNYTDSVFLSKNVHRRNELRKRYKTLCFEPSAVEVLLDWRG